MAQIKMQYASGTRQKTSFIIMNGANKRNVINLIPASDANIQSVDDGYLWNSTGTSNTHFFLIAKPNIVSGRYAIEINSDLTTNPKINFGYRLQDNDVISITISDYSFSADGVGKSTQVFDYTQGKYIALLIGTDGSTQVVNKIISSIKIRPVRLVSIDLIKQMQNKQGYTNGTSTGSFTDSQISYEVQASPVGYWEYTVYGKLDISKIKGKTFKVIYNFEDVALPTEIDRFNVRIVYSANGNYILPTSPMGGLASGISWCGSNGTDLTTERPTTSGSSQIIQNSVVLFNGVSDNTVDLYIVCIYAPQSSQSIRPSGKISIRIEGEQ